MPFFIWLFSVSIIILRFVHIALASPVPFFLPSRIPLCGFFAICLSVHLWMDVRIAPSLGLLHRKVLSTFTHVLPG